MLPVQHKRAAIPVLLLATMAVVLAGCKDTTTRFESTVTYRTRDDIRSVAGPVCTARGEYLGEKTAFLRKIEEDPGNLQSCWALARLYYADQHYELAGRYSLRAAQGIPEAAGFVEQAGVKLLELGNAPAAADLLLALCNLFPYDARKLARLAAARVACGRAAEARASLEQVLLLDPGNVDAWSLLVRLLCATGSTSDARRAWEFSEQLQPMQPATADVSYHRARVLLALDRPGDAQASLDEALKRLPDHVPTIKLLLERAWAAGGQDAAKKLVKSGVLISAASRAWAEGWIAQKAHLPEEALTRYTRATELCPGHEDYVIARMRMLASTPATADRAVRIGERLLATTYNRGEVLAAVGTAHHVLGRRKEALDCLLRAAHMLPLDAETRYRLGVALLEAGEARAAACALDAALLMAPTEPWSGEARNLRNRAEAQEEQAPSAGGTRVRSAQ